MLKLLIVLAIVLSGCAGQLDLGRVIQQVLVAIAPQAPVSSEAAAAAVKQVIERANQARQKAFATGDTAVMRDKATAPVTTS